MVKSIEIMKTRFHDINNQKAGGAIALFSNINASMHDIVFDRVTSDGDGGAIYMKESSAYIDKCSFRKCASKRHQNQKGGSAVFADAKAQPETFSLIDSVVIECFYTEEEPGDSSILVFNMLYSRTNGLNMSNNINGYGDKVHGCCSGDFTGVDNLYKMSMVSNSIGLRAITIGGPKPIMELCNIINNTCDYLSVNNMTIQNSFFSGNRLPNKSFPPLKQHEIENVIISGCWGDIPEFEDKRSQSIELVLNSFPETKNCSILKDYLTKNLRITCLSFSFL